MLERVLIVVAIALAAALLYGLWRHWQQRQLQELQKAPPAVPPAVQGGKPAVLYFTTHECAQCRLQQSPILAQLQARLDVAVHKLDAIEQRALADLYGIMTVPATVVLNPELRPVAINHGVTPLQKLQRQIVGDAN
ncbi:MAG: thioredoxin family protein [Caldilinea sp.]|jgi:thioredoxin 1